MWKNNGTAILKRRQDVDRALRDITSQAARIAILDKFAHTCVECGRQFSTEQEITNHETQDHA